MGTLFVDKLDPQSGTSLEIGSSGDTISVPSGAELKSNKISPASGTSFTLGDSGDTFTIPSGVTLANSGTATGFGQNNTPAFHAYRPDSFLAIPNDTYTTVSVSNELFDVGSAFNTSNYRFTPQVAGKYFLYANVVWDGNINSQGGIIIQKNQQFNSTDMRRNFNYATASSGVHVTGMFTANGSSDYFEYRLYQNSGSSVNITNQGNENYFGGFLVTTT